MDDWLDSWRAREIRVRGEFLSGEARIEEVAALLTIESHRREALELLVEGTGSGDTTTGAFTLDGLSVTSDGLELDARGQVMAGGPSAKLGLRSRCRARQVVPRPDLGRTRPGRR